MQILLWYDGKWIYQKNFLWQFIAVSTDIRLLRLVRWNFNHECQLKRFTVRFAVRDPSDTEIT